MKKKNNITVKNDLPHLLEALCEHPDCPDWLQDAIWEAFNNQDHNVIFTAAFWKAQFESIGRYHRSPRRHQSSVGL